MWYMNEDRQILVNAFREFAQNEVRPAAAKMEENEEFPLEAIKKLGELGMLSFCVDEELGGAGMDYVTKGLLIEELSKESHGFALLTHLQTELTTCAIAPVCTPEQIERFVKPAMAGEILLGIGFTEPTGANNMFEYEANAVMDGDEVVINGGKILITACDKADYIITCVRTGEFDPATMSGVTMVAIPTNAEGYVVGHMEKKLGWKGSHTGQVYFNNIRVPKENLIGGWNGGVVPVLAVINQAHTVYGPMNLGAMEACFDKTLNYLKNRVQCGVSLWDAHEVIRNEMARLHVKITNYRYAVYSALEERNRGADYATVEALAIALKVAGEELLAEVAGQCIEFQGGMGTVYETGIERYYRDGKMGALGCGSNKALINTLSTML